MVEWIRNWMTSYSTEISVGILGMQVVTVLLVIILFIRLGLQKRAIRRMSRKLGDGEHLKRLLESERHEGEDLLAYLRYLDQSTRQLKGRMGLVRYNAIGERAADMSFSLALLDEKGNGVVISSLFSNQGQSYIYAKPVEKGQSPYRLSEEEEKAIAQARRPLDPQNELPSSEFLSGGAGTS